MASRGTRFYFNGPRFKELRRAQRISYADLSRRLATVGCEVNHETIRSWEIGASEPRFSVALTACRLLRIDWRQVVLDGRKPEENPP